MNTRTMTWTLHQGGVLSSWFLLSVGRMAALPGMQMPELWLYRTSSGPLGVPWLGKALTQGDPGRLFAESAQKSPHAPQRFSGPFAIFFSWLIPLLFCGVRLWGSSGVLGARRTPEACSTAENSGQRHTKPAVVFHQFFCLSSCSASYFLSPLSAYSGILAPYVAS